MAFYQLCKKTSEACLERVGIIHGDSDVIRQFYSGKGLEIFLFGINIVNKEAILIGDSKEMEYSKTIWKWDHLYVLGETRAEAYKLSEKYSVINLIPPNPYPIDEINVTRCYTKDGIPTLDV